VTLSGNIGDPDMDNIPTDATLTYDCTETEDGLTGTLTVEDTEPTTAAWAFSGSADLHSSLTEGKASIVVDRNGTLVGTQTSATGPFGLARTLDVTTSLTAATGASATIDESTDWTLTFTPGASWTPGSTVVGGTLAVSGSWQVTIGDDKADATLATPTALTVDPTCATRVTGGVATATWMDGASSATLTVTWTGCGEHAATFAEQ
jgi:hypothetical protein